MFCALKIFAMYIIHVQCSAALQTYLYDENKCCKMEASQGMILHKSKRNDGMPESVGSFCGLAFGNICKNFSSIEESCDYGKNGWTDSG